MINLNDNKYSIKELPDADAILNIISDYSIWKYYYPELVLGEATNSPIRKDRNPSFSIFWSDRYNRFMFKDFATGDRGDVFVFLTKLLRLNYYEVLIRIIVDFNLTDKFYTKDIKLKSTNKVPIIYDEEHIKKEIKASARIQVKIREWNSNDIKYWNSYGICQDTLIKYRVFPISHIFLNDSVIVADEYAYVFVELKDGVEKYKVYQPFSKTLKWLGNFLEATLSGWEQLPEIGDILIISSSLKDGMCLHDLGFTNFISPQTEGYIHKEHIITHLKLRFKQIYIFYDNDKAGKEASDKICKLHTLRPIFTGVEELKDPSDYYKKMGGKKLLNIINKQL